VQAGNFTIPEDDKFHRIGTQLCPPKFTCANGSTAANLRWVAPDSICSITGEFKTPLSVNENMHNVDVGSISAQSYHKPVRALTYAIVSVKNDKNINVNWAGELFEISNTGMLRIPLLTDKDGLDYESCKFYDVQVTVKGCEGLECDEETCNARVNVINRNDRPAFVTDSLELSRSVQERSDEKTPVGSAVQATDADQSQELTFNISEAGDGSLGHFAIQSCSGQIFVNSDKLDAKIKSEYNLSLTLHDDDSFGVGTKLSTSATVLITINDVNDPPTFQDVPGMSFSILENSAPGSMLTPDRPQTQDPDADALEFSLTRNDGDMFTIDNVTGVLTVAKFGLDYEDSSRPNHRYNIEVRIDDKRGLTAVRSFDIVVQNANDAPVMYDKALSVDENSDVGTVVGSLTPCTDEDTGSTFNYEVLSEVQNEDGGVQIFRVVAASGQVVVNKKSLNFEAKSKYTIKMRCQDDGKDHDNNGRLYSDYKPIVIAINNVNEVPVMAPHEMEVDENVPVGFTIGNVAPAFDPDNEFSQVQALFYDIANDDQTNPGKIFVSPEGTVRVIGDIDYEGLPADKKFALKVMVSDNGNPVMSSLADLNVTVKNVNEPPSAVPFTCYIAENSNANDVVYNALTGTNPCSFADQTTDPDAGDKAMLRYSIRAQFQGSVNVFDPSRASFNLFIIDPATGTFKTLSDALNYEDGALGSCHCFTIFVGVQDSSGAFTNTTLQLKLKDVNDSPVFNGANISLSEDLPVGSIVGQRLTAFDEDGDSLTWDFDPGNAGNTNNAFEIVANTGQIKVLTASAVTAVDDTFALNVRVYDQKVYTTATVNIKIINKNDPPVLNSVSYNINENEGPSFVISANLSATDPDGTASLIYEIISSSPGKGKDMFALSPRGRLSALTNLDYELDQSFILTVKVTETETCVSGKPQNTQCLSTTSDITVLVQNVNEPPSLAHLLVGGKITFSIPENSPFGTPVGSALLATDPDSYDNPNPGKITYMSPGLASTPLRIDPTSGQISVFDVANLDYEATPSYDVQIVVTDILGLASSFPLHIDVTNVNERPTIIAGQLLNIPENADKGESVGCIAHSDPDGTESTAVFSIISGNTADAFSLNATGCLNVFSSLDYETQSSYSVEIMVNDGSLNATRVVIVRVSDVNDVFITGFKGALPHGTAGVDQVIIEGENFGPKSGCIGCAVSATYGPDGGTGQFSASGCSVTLANTEVTCTVAHGVGKNLKWVVTVNGHTSPASVDTTSYTPPSITSVVVAGGSIPTRGSTNVAISGNNFGPPGTSVSVTYGKTDFNFVATACSVQSDTAISCSTAPGAGSGHQWQVTTLEFGAQISAKSTDITSYTPPSITILSLPYGNASLTMLGRGGEILYIKGGNFGPKEFSQNGQVPLAQYSRNGVTYSLPATACHVKDSHDLIECVTAPNVGAGFQWRVSTIGQWSSFSQQTTQYYRPEITSISGSGAVDGATTGCEIVRINGANFGPITIKPSAKCLDFVTWDSEVNVTYGSSSAIDTYFARNCYVSLLDSEIQCLTSPGTGKDHWMQMSIGAQLSNPFNAKLSYSPPVVIEYAGPGSIDASTEGNESVVIEGRNFGLGTVGPLVTYGENGTEYEATSCSVTTPHTHITCLNAKGAGRNHKWIVSVDTQLSVVPTTWYAVPSITFFAGQGSNGGSTDGNEEIFIIGTNFGPTSPSYLDSVTYGRSGNEYTASSCSVIESSTQIRCLTVPGVGQNLKWIVTVRKQSSSPSLGKYKNGTSYQAPVLTSVVPPNGNTRGQTKLSIYGSHFGVNDLSSSIIIQFNGVSFIPSKTYQANGKDIVDMVLPEGFGQDLNVQIKILSDVDALYSNTILYSYGKPMIRSVFVSVDSRSSDGLMLVIDGSNFCKSEICGQAFIDGLQSLCTLILPWSHDRAKCQTQVNGGNISIAVGGIMSNVVEFSALSPEIDDVSKNRLKSKTYFTAGRESITITGKYFGLTGVSVKVGEKFATNVVVKGNQDCASSSDKDCFSLTCNLPALEGINVEVSILRGVQDSMPAHIDFKPPEITHLEDSGGSNIATGPTQGRSVVVVGRNLGTRGVAYFRGKLINATWEDSQHTRVRVTIPPGEGNDHKLYLLVGGQSSAQLTFSFSAPLVSSVAPRLGSTDGQEKIIVTGINFGIQGPVVKIGEKLAKVETYTHNMIEALTPSGVGKNLSVTVTVSSQVSSCSAAEPRFCQFSYKSPEIHQMFPTNGPTSGIDGNGSKVMLVLVGKNFGEGLSHSSVYWDNKRLEMANYSSSEIAQAEQAFVLSNRKQLLLFLPQGQGTNIPVYVQINDNIKSNVVYFSYDPPQLYTVSPTIGPTDGCEVWEDKTAWQQRIDGVEKWMIMQNPQLYRRNCLKKYTITLTGINFGVRDLSVFVQDFTVSSSCASCVHDHTKIIAEAPVGLGVNLTTQISVGDRLSNSIMYSFLAASVRESVPGTVGIGNGHIDSQGGETIKILGSDFGGVSSNVSVIFGTQICGNPRWHPEDRDGFPYVSCVAPRMVVGAKTATITVAKQTISIAARQTVNNTMFSSICKANTNASGFTTYFTGAIGEYCVPCPAGANCFTETYRDPVAKPTFWLAELNITRPDASVDSTDFKRAAGVSPDCKQWNEKNEECKADTNIARCPPERWNRALFGAAIIRETCHDLLPCSPAESCIGLNKCDEKYSWAYYKCQAILDPKKGGSRKSCTTDLDCDPDPARECSTQNPQHCSKCEMSQGENGTWTGVCKCQHPTRCALCTMGSHYRMGGECIECPDNPYIIIGGFITGIIIAAIGGYYLSKRKFNLSFISIGFDYFQVLALFAGSDIAWPQAIKDFFNFLRAFNFNIDIAAPECLLPDLEFEEKWYGTMAMPVGVVIILIFAHTFLILKQICLYKKTQSIYGHLSTLIASFHMIFYFLYLSLTKRALEVFNCNPLSPYDGYSYTSFTSAQCAGAGGLCRCGEGIQARLVAPAAVCFVVYSLGFPAFIAFIVRRHWDLVKEDQLLRAARTGDDYKTNVNAFEIRQRYHKLYYHFKPNKAYWMFIIILRKLGIAFAGLMFRGNPGFQLSVILLVLIAALLAQVLNNPYMSTVERANVLRDHDKKVKDGDELHKTIHQRLEAAVTQQKALDKRERHRQRKKLGDKFNEENFAQDPRNYIFDYNTVELALLASAVLICVAGVMFESDRYQGELRDDLQWQRELITVGVILVVIFSMSYYLIVFLCEAFQWTPEFAKRLMTKDDTSSTAQLITHESESDIMFRANPMRHNKEAEVELKKMKEERASMKKLDQSGQTNVQLLQMVRMEKKKRGSEKTGKRRNNKGKGKQKKEFRPRMASKSGAEAVESDVIMIGTNPMMSLKKKKKRDKISVHTDKKSGRKYSYHHGTKERKWLPKEDTVLEM
jgi:VCBS repeat-containing protein